MPEPQQSSSPTTPSSTLKISPDAIEIGGGDVQAFSVAQTGLAVEWSTEPEGLGEIDLHGIYTAPQKIENPRAVIILAKTPGGAQFGTATVTLSNTQLDISRLGWFAVVVAALLGIGLIVFWSALNVAPRQPMVVITPPEVTLDPNQDQTGFTLDAIVFGDLKNGVVWSSSDGGIDGKGVYRRAKKTVAAPVDVTVTARSVTDPSIRGTSIIHLVPGQNLAVQPASVSVFTSQQVPFRTESNVPVSWQRSRTDLGSLDEKTGIYTAPGFVQLTEPFQIVAVEPKSGARAAAAITVNAPLVKGFATDWRLLVFVILMGALGSMLYFSSSFVAYVGNRTFRSSWFWFYISRPFVGGALAIIFFFIAGSGLLTSSASASNLMMIGVIAALVGLFSDRAVRKLSDICDVVLAAKDDRADNLKAAQSEDQVASSSPRPQQGSSPKISSTDPIKLIKGQPATLIVKGMNFNNYKVSVNNGPEMDAGQPTHNSFQIPVSAEQTNSDRVTIKVINGDKTSTTFEIETETAVPPRG